MDQRTADQIAADQEAAKNQQPNLTDTQIVAAEAAEATAKAKEVETARLAEVAAAHPAQNDGHTHDFVSGLAPGGKQLRICKVSGCGFTEGL